MPPPSIPGKAIGRVTSSPSSSSFNPSLSESPHNVIKLPPSSLEYPPTSPTSPVWQRNRKLPTAPVNQVGDDEFMQDIANVTPSQPQYDIESPPFPHRELDLTSDRPLKRAKQTSTHISGEYDLLSKHGTAFSDIQYSAPTDESDGAYTEFATDSASVIRSLFRTCQNDKPEGSVDVLTIPDATQTQQYEGHRRHWADCSMDQWKQDGKELYAAFEQVLERITVGLEDDMNSIQSLKVLLDAHHHFLARRDSTLVDVKKLILGGRGVWTDDKPAL